MKNIFLIAFFIILFFGVALTVLTNMGGKSEALKNSVEHYIASALHGDTTVGTLNDMQYFPQVVVDIEDVSVTRPNITDPIFKIGSLQIAMDFWNITLGRSKLNVLNVKDIYVQAGILTKKELILKRLGIVDEKVDDPAFLFAGGKYGGRPFEGHLGLDRFGKKSPYKYKLAKEMDIFINSDPLTISGQLSRHTSRKMQIKDLSVLTPKTALSGEILFQISSRKENLYIEGDLILGKNTKLTPDLKITLDTKPANITGQIISEYLDIHDIPALVSILREIQTLTNFKTKSKATLKSMDWDDLQMDVTLEVKELTGAKKGKNEPFTAQLTIKDGKLDLGALQNKMK